jgi:uncharacterized protein CbrC (UPF0167 family)
MSIRDHFRRADPDLSDASAFVAAVTEYLHHHRHLIDRWQSYVDDKRYTPSPYMDLRRPEVGYIDIRGRRVQVHRFDDHTEACAAFILRESHWVLQRMYVTEPGEQSSGTRVVDGKQGKATLPKFRYHSDPVATGSVVARSITCICCGEPRPFAYVGPTYGVDEVPQNSLCPWCIADGSAAGRLKITFTDTATHPQLAARKLSLLTTRTPGYVAWQQDEWCYHCNDACDYRGRVGAAELTAFSSRATLAVRAALSDVASNDTELDGLLRSLDVDGDLAVHLFRCLGCNDYVARHDSA